MGLTNFSDQPGSAAIRPEAPVRKVDVEVIAVCVVSLGPKYRAKAFAGCAMSFVQELATAAVNRTEQLRVTDFTCHLENWSTKLR